MSQLGLGVMINQLFGDNSETIKAYQNALNKEIKTLVLTDDVLIFNFTDGTTLIAKDGGQSCCESRYMRTDDDLTQATGSKLLEIEIADGPEVNNDYCHEVQFLRVKTNNGMYVFSNHNEHNGYYGGFSIYLR